MKKLYRIALCLGILSMVPHIQAMRDKKVVIKYNIHYDNNDFFKATNGQIGQIGLQTLQEEMLQDKTLTCYQADSKRLIVAKKQLEKNLTDEEYKAFSFFVKKNNAYRYLSKDEIFGKSDNNRDSLTIYLVRKLDVDSFIKNKKITLFKNKEQYRSINDNDWIAVADYIALGNPSKWWYLGYILIIIVVGGVPYYFYQMIENNQEEDSPYFFDDEEEYEEDEEVY